jgi:hypothetical protein
LLKGHCFRCHEGANASSGYRLDLRAELLGETNGKPLVEVGHADKSRLIAMVTGQVPGKRMPLKAEPLSSRQIDILRAWIDQGLVWDDALLPAVLAADHWAFRPIAAVKPPLVENAGWVRNPIDAFIAAAHEEQGLTPAPPAEGRTLLRRLSLDLLGLPPSPEEMDAFLQDRARDAYERVVARWLASPHHGERWARHWLDVARWAESEGYESNHLRPYAWRYRDYVVQAFNRDKPFDRFVREQLAGDEITPYADENLIATGFLAAARLSSNEEDKALQRNDIYVDIVNATASAFLGLTMNCAQCHNHKFDSLTARDYYRLLGFFVKGQPANLALHDKALRAEYEAQRPPEHEPARKLRDALFNSGRARKNAEVRKGLAPEAREAYDLPPEKRSKAQEKLARETDLLFQFTANQIEKAIPLEDKKLYDELKKKLEAMEKKMPDRPQTFGFYSPVTSPTKIEVLPMKGFYPLPYEPTELARATSRILVQGDVHRPSFEVDVGWPAVFGPVPPSAVQRTPRLALADWLTDAKNPLTARVYVNRLWHYHFGRGLVATPGDFGTKGAPPTHPQLLDWLAGELIRSGWSTRHMHRLIVTSATYRQSSRPHADNARIDPDNKLWWRWQPRRLEAEAIRDAMLAVSGELDPKIGGPSAPADEKNRRRSLYLLQRRGSVPAAQALFDGPNAILESCAARHVSTVPLQALYLLNNDFSLNRAKAFAQRVIDKAGSDRDRQVETAFLLALGRPLEEGDRRLARRFFESQPADGSAYQALVHFCQALMNVNEFVYIH